MQTKNFRRLAAWLAAVFAAASLLAACGRADDAFAKIENPPLLRARLHTITVLSDDAAAAETLRAQGYVPIGLVSNYPASVVVQAALWGVPEPVAAKPLEFKAPGGGADLRLLVMPLAARGLTADAGTEASFYRKVLGVDVPRWPTADKLPANVRVQVWTYRIPDVREASRLLRAHGIPVVFDPVAITTAYLGDHKTMAIRAPDGTLVELVESAAQ